jgi:predicted DNA-binding protein
MQKNDNSDEIKPISLSIRVSQRELNTLDGFCILMKTTKSQIFREAVEHYVRNYRKIKSI